MIRWRWSFFLSFCLYLSCICIKPARDFSAYLPPPAPDYSLADHWAARPDTRDSADLVPANSGLSDGQADALVDVFFIHPTTYYRHRSWNADVNDRKLNTFTDRTTIKKQASVYNGSCRVYAPRYRQATLYSFMDKGENRERALDLAYQDIRRAFRHYLDHDNRGRPFIIASHSQGTHHAIRLVKELIDPDTILYRQLVCAYLIGGPVKKDCFAMVQASDSAAQTGCYVAWNTVSWGGAPRETGLDCVNPLTWRRDTVLAPADLNLGGVPGSFDRIDTNVVDAACAANGGLWVHKPRAAGYLKIGKSYHLCDYTLFYMNIRENLQVRINAYRRTH